MKNKKSTLSFREQYEISCEKRSINEASWFGIILGFWLAAAGLYNALCLEGILCVISYALAFAGMILFVLGSFLPAFLIKPIKHIKKIFGVVGNYIFRVLLIPIYLVISVLNLFTRNKFSKRFSFVQWKENNDISSEFSDYTQVKRHRHNNILFGIISDVLEALINIRMFVLIPIITILMILGMILFFASSNAVFSFVYTLF